MDKAMKKMIGYMNEDELKDFIVELIEEKCILEIRIDKAVDLIVNGFPTEETIVEILKGE